ncbi:MAG TPA: CHAT domain-containing tetratricopeptide repeat protein [Longimicrobiaceae bacterium]|nr:CHAT domain-containing tetratricopeptide repeat protein [Longimicrobiaceae bacterium]
MPAALLLLSAFGRGVAAAQSTLGADSAAGLLREGAAARREQNAGAVWRAIGLWERARAAASESGDRAAQAEALHLKGEALGALSVYDSAAAALGEALALRRAAGDHAAEGLTLVALARVDLETGRTDSARSRASQALALSQAPRGTRTAVWDAVEAGARTVIAGAMWRTATPEEAFPQLRKALELRRRPGDRRGEGEVLQMLGDAHRGASGMDSALAYYRRAAALQRAAFDPRGLAWTYRYAGLAFGWLARRDSQAIYARRALSLFREVGDRRGEGMALADIGRFYRTTSMFDSAAVTARQALALLRSVGDRWSEATAIADLGNNFRFTGHPDSAAAYMRLALDRYRETGDLHGQGWMLQSLGYLSMQQGRPDSAILFYRPALELRRRTHARGNEALILDELGVAHSRLGHADSARADYRRALRIFREGGDTWNEYYVLLDLANLGRSGSAAGDARTATVLYDSAAYALDRVLSQMGADDDRLVYVGTTSGPSGAWTLAWLAREREAGASRARLAALAAGERGRGQLLVQLMRRAGVRSRPADGGPGAIRRPGADLAAEGGALLARARRTGGTILVYQLAGDTLLRWVVPPSGALLLFASAVRRDSLAAWVGAARAEIGADDAAARGAGAGARRAPALERPPVPVAVPHGGAMERLAGFLLPEPVASRLPPGGEVVIVPAGVLGLVPFAALRLPGGDYLGARNPLRYAPSLTALGEAQARPRVSRGEFARALVVGDPAMPTVTTYTGEQVELEPLPGAGREADEVAARLHAAVLHGAAAGEKAVAARLPRAPLVHLATHGFAYASRERARDSFVALAPGGGEDGLLTVAEVLSRPERMRAELVVLSACQTGLGSVQDAEGTVGLQRAFLARGARSVMVSLWSVSDRATEALMRGFYRHWLGDADGPGKAEALRRAQADVRGTAGMEPPVFWAAFQLAGAG